jgi:cell wall-associated NlpC family hydrolase
MKYKALQEIAEKWLDKTVPYPVPDPNKLQGQCVQFVRYCLKEYYGVPDWAPVFLAKAANFWTQYEKDKAMHGHWDKLPNTPDFVPQEGDICIWNTAKGGGYGHIGIVYGPKQSVSAFTCLE